MFIKIDQGMLIKEGEKIMAGYKNRFQNVLIHRARSYRIYYRSENQMFNIAQIMQLIKCHIPEQKLNALQNSIWK